MKSAEEDSYRFGLAPTQGYLRGLGSWRLGGSGIFELPMAILQRFFPWVSHGQFKGLTHIWDQFSTGCFSNERGMIKSHVLRGFHRWVFSPTNIWCRWKGLSISLVTWFIHMFMFNPRNDRMMVQMNEQKKIGMISLREKVFHQQYQL